MLEHLPSGSAVSVATLVASFVVPVFGEIVPKAYGLGNAREWSLPAAGPLALVERVLYPVVVLFDFITRRLSTVLGGQTEIEHAYVEE